MKQGLYFVGREGEGRGARVNMFSSDHAALVSIVFFFLRVWHAFSRIFCSLLILCFPPALRRYRCFSWSTYLYLIYCVQYGPAD